MPEKKRCQMERKENKVRFCELSAVLADWKWLLTYSRRCKKMIALYIALGVLGTTVGLFGSVAGKYLIDIVTGYDTARLPLLVFAAIGSTAVSIAFDCVVSRVLKKLEIDLNNNVRADVFDRILDADWQALHAFSCGDILNRFETDTGAVGGGAVSWLPQILVTAYRLCAVFFLIWIYSPVMALIALGGAPVVLLLSAAVLKKRRAFENKLRRLGSEMTAFEAETFYTVDTVKSLGTMQSQSRKLKEKQEALRTCSLQYNMFSVRVNALLRVAGAFTQFIAMGYGLYLLWTRAITFGTLTLFLQQRSSLTSAFENAAGLIPKFLSTAISAHRVRELCELPKERHGKTALPQGALMVELQNVTAAYRNGEAVLKNVSFAAGPGEIAVLVGTSGAGKTTLVRVLLGLVYPESGRAVLRGKNGCEIVISAETRCAFSYVPQGSTLFSGTIAENLRMAKENATEEEMTAALKTACAWAFVSSLPNGVNTKITEHGGGLSEGQAQRIAIARAVLRGAPILLLDEATSALDEKTEAQVLKNLLTALPNTACILTTHRPGALKYCTRLYKTENGALTCIEVNKPA